MKRKFVLLDIDNIKTEEPPIVPKSDFLKFWLECSDIRNLIKSYLSLSDFAILNMTCKAIAECCRDLVSTLNVIIDSMKCGYFMRISLMWDLDQFAVHRYNEFLACEHYSKRDLTPQREFILKYFEKDSSIIYNFACECENLELMKWMRRCGYKSLSDHKNLMSIVIRKGNLKIVQWLKKYSDSFGSEAIVAAQYGRFDILKWLIANGWSLLPEICSAAASGGYLEIIKWARKHNCQWNRHVCSSAATNRHYDILKWAFENGCLLDTSTFQNVAFHGDLEMLEWLRAKGCSWNEGCCSQAASNGHFEILKWLRKNGCPWDKNTFLEVVNQSNLEMLKWLKENNCPWGSQVKIALLNSNNQDIVNWARENKFF